MLVSTGLGFLIAVIGTTTFIAAHLLGSSLSGSEAFFQENPWLIFVSMLVSALLTFIMNITVLKPTSKVAVDIRTGKERILRITHSLFFIPTKWWPLTFIALGMVLTLLKADGVF